MKKNNFKGTGYQVAVDEDDTTFVTLSTGIAQINFNRVDYGDGFCALWLDGQIVCSI
jgi:hypothetical protein